MSAFGLSQMVLASDPQLGYPWIATLSLIREMAGVRDKDYVSGPRLFITYFHLETSRRG